MIPKTTIAVACLIGASTFHAQVNAVHLKALSKIGDDGLEPQMKVRKGSKRRYPATSGCEESCDDDVDKKPYKIDFWGDDNEECERDSPRKPHCDYEDSESECDRSPEPKCPEESEETEEEEDLCDGAGDSNYRYPEKRKKKYLKEPKCPAEAEFDRIMKEYEEYLGSEDEEGCDRREERYDDCTGDDEERKRPKKKSKKYKHYDDEDEYEDCDKCKEFRDGPKYRRDPPCETCGPYRGPGGPPFRPPPPPYDMRPP